MTTAKDSPTKGAGPRTAAGHRRAPRVAFRFDGVLDDVPLDAAAALVRTVRVLLAHGDEHEGRPASVRVAKLGALLNLWLSDPECSTTCLNASGLLAEITQTPAPGEVRVVLHDKENGGLGLHWVLLIASPTTPHVYPGKPPHRAPETDERKNR